MPPVIGAMRHAPEACLLDHPREGGARREAADRFDEIAVGLGVAGDEAAEGGDDVERIGS